MELEAQREEEERRKAEEGQLVLLNLDFISMPP